VKLPTGQRLARMRQYRRNYLRAYPKAGEEMVRAQRASLRVRGRLLFAVFTVGTIAGYLLAWRVLGR
jgi:hypothetical protein